MILDSSFWKNELNKDLRIVNRRLQKAKISDEQKKYELASLYIEKFAFNSAFIIRKLVESKKISDEFESIPIQIQTYKRINPEKAITPINRHRIDEFYDLGKPSTSTLSVVNICNAFIHSFIFEIAILGNEDSLDGIFFNSDKTKDAIVFFIQLDKYFKVIESVINDDILTFSIERKESKIHKSRKYQKTRISK